MDSKVYMTSQFFFNHWQNWARLWFRSYEKIKIKKKSKIKTKKRKLLNIMVLFFDSNSCYYLNISIIIIMIIIIILIIITVIIFLIFLLTTYFSLHGTAASYFSTFQSQIWSTTKFFKKSKTSCTIFFGTP